MATEYTGTLKYVNADGDETILYPKTKVEVVEGLEGLEGLEDVLTMVESMTTLITGTLTAGSTSLTLSNSNITTSSIIDIYIENEVGIAPTAVTVSSGKIIMTFDALEKNIKVGVRCL